MGARDLITSTEVKTLGTAKVSIATVTTTYFDFGTPDTTAITVLDAPDSSGSIGTTAAAVTSGTLTGGTGDQYAMIGVKVQPGRPWLKIGVVRASGTTDTTVAQCTVLSVPRNF